MIKWFVENGLGLYPPILERRLRRMRSGDGRVPVYGHRECSVSYMLSIIPRTDATLQQSTLFVRGYQRNSSRATGINFTAELDVDGGYVVRNVVDSRIVSFSCHDMTILYMFISTCGRTNVYYCEFSGCCSLRDPRIPVYEVELFETDGFYRMSKTPSYDLELRSINVKSKTRDHLHYNWTNAGLTRSVSLNSCTVEIEQQDYRLHGYYCIFCFKQLKDEDSLVFHVNHLHSNYRCLKTDRGLSIGGVNPGNADGRSLLYLSNRYRNRKSGAQKKTVWHCRGGDDGSVDNVFADGLAYLINKDIAKSKGLSPSSVALMRNWNILRLNRNDLADDVLKFVRQEKDNPHIIDFLFILYHKSVINPKELVRLLYELYMIIK